MLVWRYKLFSADPESVITFNANSKWLVLSSTIWLYLISYCCKYGEMFYLQNQIFNWPIEAFFFLHNCDYVKNKRGEAETNDEID